ncbi:MAG: flagellin lysine-N-methylase [Clostridium sp.]
MNILEGFNYKEFNCIADKCKDSCCIGWKVTIDKNTYNKYKKVKGEFGKTIVDSIGRDRTKNTNLEYGKMKLDEEKRCSLLNKDGLCRIHGELGEDYLCNTCKTYPRKYKLRGEIVERNLTLSCPVVAESFINKKDGFTFDFKEEGISALEKEFIVKEKYNKELYNLLFQGRIFSIELAQFRELPMWKRITYIMIFNEKLQEVIKEGSYEEGYKLIDSCRATFCEEAMINSLDNIPKVKNVKIAFNKAILRARSIKGIPNKTFNELLVKYDKFVEGKTEEEIIDLFGASEGEFNKYFKENEYILENYLVYNLYDNYMNSLTTKNVKIEVVKLVISYSIIRMLLMVVKEQKEDELDKEDIIDVLYSFSRTIEHNESFMKNLYENMKFAGYDSTAYLTILIR